MNKKTKVILCAIYSLVGIYGIVSLIIGFNLGLKTNVLLVDSIYRNIKLWLIPLICASFIIAPFGIIKDSPSIKKITIILSILIILFNISLIPAWIHAHMQFEESLRQRMVKGLTIDIIKQLIVIIIFIWGIFCLKSKNT